MKSSEVGLAVTGTMEGDLTDVELSIGNEKDIAVPSEQERPHKFWTRKRLIILSTILFLSTVCIAVGVGLGVAGDGENAGARSASDDPSNPPPAVTFTPEECRERAHECNFNIEGDCYYIRLNVGAYNLYKDSRYYRCHHSCSFCDCVNGSSFNNVCGWWDETGLAEPDYGTNTCYVYDWCMAVSIDEGCDARDTNACYQYSNYGPCRWKNTPTGLPSGISLDYDRDIRDDKLLRGDLSAIGC